MHSASGTEKDLTAATVPGIDLSHYQVAVDWQAVVRAGYQYCFIKATEGMASVDRLFARHWEDSRRSGILRGAYHFFRPKISPKSQAALFLRALRKVEPGDLPPVLDLEAPSEWADIVRSDRAGLALRWLQTIEDEIGVTPIIYLSPAFACEVLENSPELARYPVWLAHYTSAEAPLVPKPWVDWTFWQHRNSTIPGISGPVDLNRFNGRLEDLKILALPV